MNPFTSADLVVIQPLTFLASWASVLLAVDLFIPAARRAWTAALAALGLFATLFLTALQIGAAPAQAFGGMVVMDGFSTLTGILLLVCGLLGIAVAYGYIKRMGLERGEYYTLLLFSLSGMMLMTQAADLIVVFLALELLSIPLYVLSAFASTKTESQEAGLKYFLMGAFASGFVLYGIALVFGATGSTSLADVVAAGAAASPVLLTIGSGLILVGFAFKIAAVPFHMWTPDVYQGAPSAVTAFMSAGAKIAGFAALLRVFGTAFGPGLGGSPALTDILWALAALTMIVGNIVAIAQTNIKRLLAHSSIAHAGYMLMAFVPFQNPNVLPESIAAGLFYLVSYAITNFGAWAVVIALEKHEGKGLEITDYAGLARRYPLLAASMAIFMLSFIGLPPTMGLIGKIYLFRAAIDGGFYGLAIIGVLTSLISAYYYLRVVVVMYMREGEPSTVNEPLVHLTSALTAIITILFCLAPQALFTWATTAVLRLF